MRFTVLFALCLMFVGCSSDEGPARKWETTAAAVDVYCSSLCGWADECGHPMENCLAGCTSDVCARESVDCAAAPAATDAEIDKCLFAVEAQRKDCTESVPASSSCVAPFGAK